MRSFFSATDQRYQVDLPRDVWHSIADFLPPEDLINLYSITAAWLYRSLKLRYGVIRVEKWEDQLTYRLLNHIKTPFCAAFVRQLDVKLVETRQFGIQGRPGIIPSSLSICPISLHNLRRQTKSSYTYLSSCLSQRPIPTFDQTMDLLISVMPALSGIETFSVDCWDLDPNFSLQRLLTTAWSSFGFNLNAFVFNGNLDSFPHLAASKPFIPNLKTLELEITVNLYSTSREYRRELDSLENHIAPFISSLSSHLESLTFFFWCDLDLSTFFNIFPPTFDKLQHVSLRMPYNKAYQDPSGLLRFLSPATSRLLRDLQIRLNPTGAALDRTPELDLAQFLLTMLTTNGSTTFTALRSLEIFPTHLPEGLTMLQTAISRSADTLTKVSIRDRSLQVDELRNVVSVLGMCANLEMLRFNLSRLDADVVDLLAVGLPTMKRLSMYIDESRNVVEPSISPTLEEDMATRDFTSWQLRDIGLWRAGSRVDTRILEAFARHIPNVTSFWGDGHMDQDQLVFMKHQQRGEGSGVSVNVKKFCGCLSVGGFIN